MKKLTSLLLLTTCLGAIAPLSAQEETTTPTTTTKTERPKRNNVIKTYPFRTIGTFATTAMPINFNLAYERVIIPKLSIQLLGEYGPSRALKIPSALPISGLTSPTLKSFGVNPQLRFYPGKKGAPRGFYLAGDFAYRKYTVEAALDQPATFDVNTVVGVVPYTHNFTLDMTGTASMIGGGIGFGTQWLAGDRVSIDILWIGFGVNKVNVGLDLVAPLPTQTEIAHKLQQDGYAVSVDDIDHIPTWKDIEQVFDQELGDDLKSIPVIGNSFDLKASNNGIGITVGALAPRLRVLNFAIGVAF